MVRLAHEWRFRVFVCVCYVLDSFLVLLLMRRYLRSCANSGLACKIVCMLGWFACQGSMYNPVTAHARTPGGGERMVHWVGHMKVCRHLFLTSTKRTRLAGLLAVCMY
eukprot:3569906-Amphidinium_carterae.1